MRAAMLELRKMKRLHTLPITALTTGTGVAMGVMTLFSPSTQADFTAQDGRAWAGLLLTLVMANALTHPVLVAVLASRQVEIEHSGAGWTFNATAGRPPGALCRAKIAALSVVLVPAVAAEFIAVWVIAKLMGVTAPFNPGAWVLYAALLCAVDMVFLGVHVLVSATWDNQIISVGLGLVGAFVAVYMLLSPTSLARWVPWGYYALTSSVSIDMEIRRAVYTPPETVWSLGFVLVGAVTLVALTRRLDQLER